MELYNVKELEQMGGKVELLFSGVISATGNSKSVPGPKWVMPFKEADFYQVCTAKSGTSPTLDTLVIKKFPYSDNWATIATFAQINDVAAECKNVAANIGENVALSWTLGGSATPTFTVSIYMIGKIR